MKSILKSTLIASVLSIFSFLANAQTKTLWTPAHILSFNSLKADSFVLLHNSFIQPEKQDAQHLTSIDFPSSLQLATQKGELAFRSDLAADNPMFWSFKIIDANTAEWYNLSCDCNIGLESAIFGNKPNPYKKKMATLYLQKDGTVKVTYTEDFKKDILEKTSFSNEFFLDEYKVYQLEK